MNWNVEELWCIEQRVKFSSAQVPIGGLNMNVAPCKGTITAQEQTQETPVPSRHHEEKIHFVRLCRPLVHPAYTKLKASVVTILKGLFVLGTKHSFPEK